VGTTTGEKGLTEVRSRVGAFTGELVLHLLFERNPKRAGVDPTTLELHFTRISFIVFRALLTKACGPVQAPGGLENPFLKTAAAAEKMTNLAAPGNGVGEGGRDACKVECGTGLSQGGPVRHRKGRSLDQSTVPQDASTRELASFQIWTTPKPPPAVRI